MAFSHEEFKSPVNLQESLAKMVENRLYQDTMVVCRDQVFSSSRLVLALSFPILENVLVGVKERVTDWVILLPDFAAEDIKRRIAEFFFHPSDPLEEEYVKDEDDIKEECGDSDVEDHMVGHLELNYDYEGNDNAVEDYSENKPNIEDNIILDGTSMTCGFACGHLFENETEKVEHEKLHIVEVENRVQFKCLKCGQFLASKYRLQNHHGTSWCKIQSCGFGCEQVFESVAGKVGHEKLHRVEAENRVQFKCLKCGQFLASKYRLQSHHGTSRCKFNSEPTDKYECDGCEKIFKRVDDLSVHMEASNCKTSLNRCYFCEEEFPTKRELKLHKKRYKDGENYKCPENDCSKTYVCKKSLMCHIKAHRGQFDFPCEHCGKLFPTKHHLNSHVTLVHCEGRPFICHICSTTHKTNGTLLKHIQIVHTGKDRYPCSECGKGFPDKRNLLRHFTTHTGERNYSCSICGKTFVSKEIMNKHEMVVHQGIKKFECVHCGKAFGQQSNLKKHELVHTGVMPFSCNSCGKRFIQKSNMKTHELKCTLSTTI